MTSRQGDLDGRRPIDVEHKLMLLEEIERLKAEQELSAAGAGPAMLPAVLFAILAPFVLDLPIWLLVAVIGFLAMGGVIFILTKEVGRMHRAKSQRIQYLERELRLLESLGHLTDEDRAIFLDSDA